MAKKAAAKKAKAPKAAKPAAKKTAGNEPLVVTSKMKAFIKSQGMMTSSDAIGSINEKVYAILGAAVLRAQANRRSTIKPQDL